MILLDTSGLLAAIDSSQNQHAKSASALREASPPLLLSPFVLAELDYLLAVRVLRLEPFTAQDVASAAFVLRRYPGLEIGLADASIVVLAERYGVLDVLTLDQRHFNSLRGPGGKRFRLLPAPELALSPPSTAHGSGP